MRKGASPGYRYLILLVIVILFVFSGCAENGTNGNDAVAGDWLALSVEGSPVELGSPYDVGTAEIGSTGTTTFTVTNNGDAGVTLEGTDLGIALTGTDAAEFSLDLSSTATTLGQGESTSLVLEFSPVGDIGSRTAGVTLRSDADESAYVLDVTGTAGGAVITVALWDGEVETALNDGDPVNFGTVNGTEERTFRVGNSGNIPLEFSSIAMSGTYTEDDDVPAEDRFYWDTLPSTDALAPGSTRELIVKLQNQSYSGGEAAEATITFDSNSIGDGVDQFTIDLSATLY